MQKTFNLYCDESCHLEHDHHSHMLLGYVCSPFNQVKQHHEHIRALKEKHHCYGEIKWAKVSQAQVHFYLDLIDYFFATDLRFRAVVIDKSRIKNAEHGQDFDTFYYKMYYQLIHHQIDMRSKYNIYLDIKDTLSVSKVRRLGDILKTQYGVINILQNIHSHESLLLQLADLIMGAVGYYVRGEEKVIAKNKLIERIKKQSGSSMEESTIRSASKFNLFFIDLK